jgi:hypothetical protein
MDGRVADIEGGGFVLFDRFLISAVQKDCCTKPIVWGMARWKKTYDLRGDPQIDIRYEYGEPSYS